MIKHGLDYEAVSHPNGQTFLLGDDKRYSVQTVEGVYGYQIFVCYDGGVPFAAAPTMRDAIFVCIEDEKIEREEE